MTSFGKIEDSSALLMYGVTLFGSRLGDQLECRTAQLNDEVRSTDGMLGVRQDCGGLMFCIARKGPRESVRCARQKPPDERAGASYSPLQSRAAVCGFFVFQILPSANRRFWVDAGAGVEVP